MGDPTIGGRSRAEWRLYHLRVLMHETGHIRFAAAQPNVARAGACSFSTIRAEFHEIAADMEDFWAMNDLLSRMTMTPAQRTARLAQTMRTRWLPRAESNWKQIRCVCDCVDAIDYLQQTNSTMTKRWPRALKRRFHTWMRLGIPTWPVKPPPRRKGDFPLPRGGIGYG